MLRSIMIYIESLLPYIGTMGDFAYLLVFVAALAESLPVIGVFLPGTFILIFLGYSSSEGFLNVWLAIFVAALGAFIGELVGYCIGRYGRSFLHEQMKWFKVAHIDAAQKYFHAHGGKSVFIGRFIGPIRSVISIVAGMSHMRASIFNFYNAIGAILWSVLYTLLGYFFGQEWRTIDLYMRDVTRGVLAIIFIIVFGYCLFIFFKKRNRKLLE